MHQADNLARMRAGQLPRDERTFWVEKVLYASATDPTRWGDNFREGAACNAAREAWERRIAHKLAEQTRQEQAEAAARAAARSARHSSTSAELIRAEHDRRVADGRYHASIGAEGRALSDWLAHAHPKVRMLKPRTIENIIRPDHPIANT
jgi:hypothetical protein